VCVGRVLKILDPEKSFSLPIFKKFGGGKKDFPFFFSK
jgi:hypothetical protein